MYIQQSIFLLYFANKKGRRGNVEYGGLSARLTQDTDVKPIIDSQLKHFLP